MHLPPVEPVSYSEIYVSGDVTIHESAVVAPGTILKAAPNSRIDIGAGVCIGMGAVLNACEGEIEVKTGAVLGSGVLVIGCVKIGDNACIGSSTTLFNVSIEKKVVIPAGTLMSDESWQEIEVAAISDKNSASLNGAEEPALMTDLWEEPPTEAQNNSSTSETVDEREATPAKAQPPATANNGKSPASGQVYINQLLVTLFPERNLFKRPQQNSE
jgi:carbon dioxide concentrating mechanism protein CcmN